MKDTVSPEQAINTCRRIERLVANLGRPKVLEAAIDFRKTIARSNKLENHEEFEVKCLEIERMMNQGNIRDTLRRAQQLLAHVVNAGEDAYPTAAYNIAGAHYLVGRALQNSGSLEESLTFQKEAFKRFQTVANRGNSDGISMANTALIAQGDCLTKLGRLDEAARVYNEAMQNDKNVGRLRSMAIGVTNLAQIRMLQGQFEKAITEHLKAKSIYERLREPILVAMCWRDIGRVYDQGGKYDLAERSFRKSLAINVQENQLAGQANVLGLIGIVYCKTGRLKDAISLYRQALVIDVKLNDRMSEGRDRNNLAIALKELKKYDEARQEFLHVLECTKPYGHAGQPWITWSRLFELEIACGRNVEALSARNNAIAAFLSYRRDGGQSSDKGLSNLINLVTGSIKNHGDAAEKELMSMSQQNPRAYILCSKLIAIIKGERDPVLVNDPKLNYDDAAELLLLLEQL